MLTFCKCKLLTIMCILGFANISHAETQPSEAIGECLVEADFILGLQTEIIIHEDKIFIMGELSKLSDDDLKKCLEITTPIELVALTVLDLSRHTDPKVAGKAKELAKRFNLLAYINEEIGSGDKDRQQRVVELLARIEAKQAKEIIAQITFPSDEVKTEITTAFLSTPSRVLIPSSYIEKEQPQDRYYIQVTWDSQNQPVVGCLTELIYIMRGLKTLDEKNGNQNHWAREQNKMQSTNNRWLFWKKYWAIDLADGVTKCGGNASFVKRP